MSKVEPCAVCGSKPRTRLTENPYHEMRPKMLLVEEYYCPECENRPIVDKWNNAQRKIRESKKDE